MSKMDKAKIGAVAVVGASILALALWPRSPQVAEVGAYSPDFTLPIFDAASGAQGSIHLYDHRGHVVLVNFWASWCLPCIEETPSLAALAASMQKQGVEVIGVSVDQDTDALKKFITDQRLTFPIARDPDQIVSWRFGTHQFPETYILDRDGRVAEKIIGATDWRDPQMVNFIENLANPAKTGK